jgi:protein ImuA
MTPVPSNLAALRRTVASIEKPNRSLRITPLGYACADAVLQGGLRHGALHEIYAGDASQGGAATGFVCGFATRLSTDRDLVWITTDFCTREYGALCASGLVELGIDPSRVLFVRLANPKDAIRATGDVLACKAVGAVVLETEGRVAALNLNTSRRLSFAAAQRDVPVIVLRIAAKPEASAAETRWLIHAAASPPLNDDSDFGAPHFSAQLLRNRHGENGEWRIEWNGNNGLFTSTEDRRRTADTVRLAAAAADRSAPAKAAGTAF